MEAERRHGGHNCFALPAEQADYDEIVDGPLYGVLGLEGLGLRIERATDLRGSELVWVVVENEMQDQAFCSGVFSGRRFGTA